MRRGGCKSGWGRAAGRDHLSNCYTTVLQALRWVVGPSLRKFKDRPGGWKWLNVADFKRLPHPPGGVGEGGRKGKKSKLRQTKARQTDEQREGDSLSSERVP